MSDDMEERLSHKEMAESRGSKRTCCLVSAAVLFIGLVLSMFLLIPALFQEAHRKAVCSWSHLRQIGLGIQMYANDFGGHLPPHLSTLYPQYVSSRILFICHSTEDPPPDPQPGVRFQPNRCSYGYVYHTEPIDRITTPPSTTVLAYDKLGNHRGGANVLFLDGHVEWRRGFVPPDCAPLHVAAFNGHQKTVERLIEVGADVNVRDSDHFTPLHYAAERGNRAVAALLIGKGADVNAKGSSDVTALHEAVRHGHREMAHLLIEKGAEVNAKDAGGWTALHWAASESHTNVASLLIEKAADVNTRDGEERTPLDVAWEPETQDLLRKRGGRPGRPKASDLIAAARAGDVGKLKALLAAGAKINATDGACGTALHNAKDAVTADFLVANGADISAKGQYGKTPLHDARSAAIAEFLLSKGADIEAKDDGGNTPLHRAAYAGRKDVVEVLIARGADVSATDDSGNTPLHDTAPEGRTEVAKLLISNGAKLDARARCGCTPLHRAASFGQKDLAELLIAHGADVSAEAHGPGDTPLSHAIREGHQGIAALLRKHGAKTGKELAE